MHQFKVFNIIYHESAIDKLFPPVTVDFFRRFSYNRADKRGEAVQMPQAVVIGAVNMDIGAISTAPLREKDSNPGRVRTALGGVGRNIAHNLCLLGVDTAMITVLG